MARPIPVLPLVASMTVCPGFNCPESSAASITPSASRSLTEPRGLNASIFTNRFASGGASLLILTTGVLPIVSRMFPNRRPIRPPSAALPDAFPFEAHSMLEGDRRQGQPNTSAHEELQSWQRQLVNVIRLQRYANSKSVKTQTCHGLFRS